MKLNSIRIGKSRWCLKPLRCLDTILTTSHQSNDSLGIKSARIVDCLEKDRVEFIDFSRILSIVARGLVDRLESDKAGLAS